MTFEKLKVVALTILIASAVAMSATSSIAAAPGAGGLTQLARFTEDTNLLRNGSFEEVQTTRLPTAWGGGPPNHFASTEVSPRTGTRSAHLTNSHEFRYYPGLSQEIALSPGWYVVRGWIKSEAVGDRGDSAGGRISLAVGGRPITSTEAVGGKRDWTRVETTVRINAATKGALRLEAFRKPDGNVFFDDVEVRRLVPPVVDGFLLYPNYRGMLFTDRSQMIQMAVTMNAADQRRDSDTRVRLRLLRGADVVATAAEDRPSPAFRMSLDAAQAPAGEYDLVLEAVNGRTGEIIAQQPPYRVIKLASASRPAKQTYVDHDQVLVLGGRRTFPLGIYDTGGYGGAAASYAPRMAAIAEAPLDLYINYQLGGAPAGYPV